MKITVKVGILFAFAWMLIKMGIFMFSANPEINGSVMVSSLINMLFLLLAISIGLYLHKRKETEESNALSDIKNAMTAGVPYIILVSIFIYLFYTEINPGFIEHKLNETIAAVDKGLNDPEQLEEFRQQAEDAEVMTKGEIRKRYIENQKVFTSAGFTSTVALLAMLLLATLNSIFVTLVYRKLLFKR